jgi:hypothetical protein
MMRQAQVVVGGEVEVTNGIDLDMNRVERADYLPRAK